MLRPVTSKLAQLILCPTNPYGVLVSSVELGNEHGELAREPGTEVPDHRDQGDEGTEYDTSRDLERCAQNLSYLAGDHHLANVHAFDGTDTATVREHLVDELVDLERVLGNLFDSELPHDRGEGLDRHLETVECIRPSRVAGVDLDGLSLLDRVDGEVSLVVCKEDGVTSTPDPRELHELRCNLSVTQHCEPRMSDIQRVEFSVDHLENVLTILEPEAPIDGRLVRALDVEVVVGLVAPEVIMVTGRRVNLVGQVAEKGALHALHHGFHCVRDLGDAQDECAPP